MLVGMRGIVEPDSGSCVPWRDVYMVDKKDMTEEEIKLNYIYSSAKMIADLID